jgi:tetratricopeptide (TPR) repeat protein
MQLHRRISGFVLVAVCALLAAATPATAQIGKSVPVPAGSDADHALSEINATTDPTQKLALIDKFAGTAQGDMAIVVDDLYVNYYLNAKNYDKAFEYGDKGFAIDPDNFANAVNMVRAAQEKGDSDKLFSYGAKAADILKRYKASSVPDEEKKRNLENAHDNIVYVQQLIFNGAYQTKDPTKRAAQLVQFAQMFPDSPYADQAMGVAAASYRQSQNTAKMVEVANGLLAKDPNNVGMLLLLADYYSEKGEQLDKAEADAKKATAALADAKKPEGVTDEQWQQQVSLQKGLALSALGQVNIQKRNNAGAVENLKAASPLLKSDAGSYARNQYRLGYALLNLKRVPEAKQAFTDAASVDSPYKQPSLDKLKAMSGASASARAKS